MFFNRAGRHYWFAKYLKQAGYSPVVFCSSNLYNSDESVDTGSANHKIMETDDGVPFVFIKTSSYLGNGLSRLKNMYSYYRKLFPISRQIASRFGKPDVIYASSVHPLTLVAGIKLAKRLHIPCISEIRDLWPESLVAFGYLKAKNLITRLLYLGEKWIYKKSDRIIFLAYGDSTYIKDMGWEKAIPASKFDFINNGIDIAEFDKNCEEYILPDADLDDPDKTVVLFTGSFGQGQNLSAFLDVAKIYLQKNSDLRFVLYGNGAEKKSLMEKADSEGLTNVVFHDQINRKYVPSLVKRADINYLSLNYGDKKISTLHKYGQSQNKLFEYMAAGKPIVQTIDPAYNLLTEYDCGLSTQEQNADEISSCIDRILADRAMYERFSRNARAAAAEFDAKKLTEKLIDSIEKT
jgi:glycosyltransferase involved in cell wall biosynthesis